jgi:hypothetical protein
MDKFIRKLHFDFFVNQRILQFIQYVSFENHIEQHKKAYYEVLMSGQRKRNTKNEQISLWLLFFLESWKSLTEKLEQKYSVFKQIGGYLNERQKQIRDFIAQNQPVKVGDVSAHFREIPINTIKKDLQYLRDEQVLTMIGKGKGSVYVIFENKNLKIREYQIEKNWFFLSLQDNDSILI